MFHILYRPGGGGWSVGPRVQKERHDELFRGAASRVLGFLPCKGLRGIGGINSCEQLCLGRLPRAHRGTPHSGSGAAHCPTLMRGTWLTLCRCHHVIHVLHQQLLLAILTPGLTQPARTPRLMWAGPGWPCRWAPPVGRQRGHLILGGKGGGRAGACTTSLRGAGPADRLTCGLRLLATAQQQQQRAAANIQAGREEKGMQDDDA